MASDPGSVREIFSKLQRELLSLEPQYAALKTRALNKFTSGGLSQYGSGLNHNEAQKFANCAYEKCLGELFERLATLGQDGTPEERKEVVEGFRALVPSSIWCLRGLQKPLGYAGDYMMMHYVYEFAGHFPVDDYNSLTGWALDRWALTYAADVKERTAYLAERIQAVIDEMPDGDRATLAPARICSIACGPFGEIAELESEVKAITGSGICFSGIDVDAAALEFVKNRYNWSSFSKPTANVDLQLYKANVVAAATPGSTYPKLKDLAPQHLVYSVGLMDYLDDRSLIEVADWAYDALLPGGKLVLGNFNRDASNRVASVVAQFMEHVLDWKLIYRTPEELVQLLGQSKFGSAGAHIDAGQKGLQLYICSSKPLFTSKLSKL